MSDTDKKKKQNGRPLWQEGLQVAHEEYLKQKHRDYLKGEAEKSKKSAKKYMNDAPEKMFPWMAAPFLAAGLGVSAAAAPIPFLLSTIGGAAGDYAVNETVDASSDKYSN